MRKISVIVPMYNSEDTIEECIESIIEQSIFKDMDIIVVDDHSIDGSVIKVMKYEQKYPDHILLIKLDENGGPGHARNVALKYATGKYIGFVDSDDAVVNTMYEKLYDTAVNSNADCVDTGFFNQKEDKAIIYTTDDLSGVQDSIKRSGLIASGGYIYSKLFRKDFLEKENIYFRNEYVLEDMDFLIQVFAKAAIISNVKEILYIYRNTEDSLSKVIEPIKYCKSTARTMRAIYEKTAFDSNYIGIQEAVEYTMLQLYSYSVNMCLDSLKKGLYTSEIITGLLDALRKLRAEVATSGYENSYLKEKVKKTDIDIMTLNDLSPYQLVQLILEKD